MNIEAYAARRSKITVHPALLIASVAFLFYPFFISFYGKAVGAYGTEGPVLIQIVSAVSALLLMAAATLTPILAIWVLSNEQKAEKYSQPKRLALHLFAATPPLYIFSIQMLGLAGLAQWRLQFWILFAATLFLLAVFSKPTESDRSESKIRSLRIFHGVVALSLLMAFFLFHVANHVVALWSEAAHIAVMEFGRQWYRSSFFEPVLLVLIGLLGVSGGAMVLRYTKRRGDIYRTLQTTSGTYLALFLCAHLFATLGARGATETNWYFAVGKNGLLDGLGILTAYYILSIMAIITHAACGLRLVLLAHGAQPGVANRTFFFLFSMGLLVTTLISIAMFDFHIVGEN